MQTYEARRTLAQRDLTEGRLPQAVETLKGLLEERPEDITARDDLAFGLSGLGRHQEAAQQYVQLSQLAPKSGIVQHNLGLALQQLGLSQEAIACFQRARDLDVGLAEPCRALAEIYRQQGRLQEAIEYYRQTLTRRPQSPEALQNLACLFLERCEYDQAIPCFEEAIRLRPDWAEIHYNYALALRELGRLPEAITSNRRALQLNPDLQGARWTLCHLLLLSGRYPEAWDLYDWWRCHLQPLPYESDPQAVLWQGQSFVGRRLLVQWEQGYGDNMQFLRFLPWIKRLGGTVILAVPEVMRDLLVGMPHVDEWVIGAPGHLPKVPFDFYVPLLDVSRIFQLTLETIPCEIPYLRAPQERLDQWRDRLQGPEFKIGMVWSSNPDNGNNYQRFCRLDDFLPLMEIPGVQWYSLQKGPAARELEACKSATALVNLGPDLRDFADTAAVMEYLDLVITVDTAALHLSGAMGKSTWCVLRYAPDWRFMRDRKDSPWYPTLRLFRQQSPGDWSGPFAAMKQQLLTAVRSQ